MYKVIKHFTDIQDNGYSYKVGDTFPHNGFSVSNARIEQLLSKNNRQGVPLIAKEKEFLNPATPARSEKVERETPYNSEVTETKKKPKRVQKTKKD